MQLLFILFLGFNTGECHIALCIGISKNTTAPSLPPQQLSNIEMVECKAYDTSSTQMNNIEMKKCQAYDMVARK